MKKYSISSPDAPEIDQLLSEYWKDRRASLLLIPFDAFEYFDDYRVAELIALWIAWRLKKGFTCHYLVCYDEENIVFLIGDVAMKAKYTVEIPYGSRSKYFPLIHELNQLVAENGLIYLFVDNVPYHLMAMLAIETDSLTDEIETLLKKSGLSLDFEKGFDELFEESLGRRWNIVCVPFRVSLEELKDLIDPLFVFAQESALAKKGYSSVQFKRKKVFVSYSHADKELVNQAVERMRQVGVNVWIDTAEILGGEHIVTRITQGIEECDLAVFFLSRHTVDAIYPNYELRTIMTEVVEGKKAWYLVKVDDVDLKEKKYQLAQYKYYDFSVDTSIDDLVADMKRKLDSLNPGR